MRFGAGFISDHRTASLLISLREAARKVPNCAQPIILAYRTYASAKVSRHSVAAWLYAHCCKVNVDYCARPPPGPHKFRKSPRSIRIRRVIEI